MKFTIISMLFLFISCSDNMKVTEPECECYLEVKTTKVKTGSNGLPYISTTTTYLEYPVNDCSLDGIVINEDKTDLRTIRCN